MQSLSFYGTFATTMLCKRLFSLITSPMALSAWPRKWDVDPLGAVVRKLATKGKAALNNISLHRNTSGLLFSLSGVFG